MASPHTGRRHHYSALIGLRTAGHRNRKSSATRFASVTFLSRILVAASIVICTSAPTCVLADCTAARLAKRLLWNSSTSPTPLPAVKSVIVSLPNPVSNTKVSLPRPPDRLSLPPRPRTQSLPVPPLSVSPPMPPVRTLSSVLPVPVEADDPAKVRFSTLVPSVYALSDTGTSSVPSLAFSTRTSRDESTMYTSLPMPPVIRSPPTPPLS